MFPAEVRAEMSRQGIRPVNLSKKSGLNESAVSRKIMSGTRKLSLDEVVAISRALGIPAWELMRHAESQEVRAAA